jgi:hypothetical protein
MLHLFNSCYLYPDVLFDASSNYVVVGENHHIYGFNVENSFYYNNVQTGQCLGRFSNVHEFVKSDVLKAAISNKEQFAIYADADSFLKIHASFLKTQVKNLTLEFYVEAARVLGARLGVVTKYTTNVDVKNNLSTCVDALMQVNSIPEIDRFNVTEDWVKTNAGIEWQIASGNYKNIPKMIDRFVFSFIEEARINFLSRKEPSGWVVDSKNFNINTVKSMKDLYNNIRKEVFIQTDTLILDFYSKKHELVELVKKPEFLLILASNKETSRKVDIWLLRLLLNKQQSKLEEIGVIA